MIYRIGIGYDIHRFVDERTLYIGGVEIPYIKGLLGHSDGDVLLHALCDALLGAMSMGDIGEHFPDTDPKYRGISSAQLLKEVAGILKEKKFTIANVDTVVIAEEPKLSPFKKHIQQKISELLGIECGQVSVKAKTNEGMGEIGKKEAIAAEAVALLIRRE